MLKFCRIRNRGGRATGSNTISKGTVTTSSRGNNKTSRCKRVASTVERIIIATNAERRVEPITSVVLLITSSRIVHYGETKAIGVSNNNKTNNS